MCNSLKKYKSLSIKTRTELALAENIPQEYRSYMPVDQWNVVRCYFARRADLTPDEVATLIDDEDHVVRLCIAKRNDLNKHMVEKCVLDEDPNVRHAVARNILLNDKQRELLLKDIDELVQLATKKGPREIRYRQRPGQAKLIK